MMYKTLIVDDNRVAIVSLQAQLSKFPNIEVVDTFSSALETLDYLKQNTIDILFLDVEMPKMSGLELLRILPNNPITILVTAKVSYAMEAFELNVADYLVKDKITLPRLQLAISKAIELCEAKHSSAFNNIDSSHIFIKYNKVTKKLLIDDILWIEAKGDYVKINTTSGNYVIHSTMKNLEESLPQGKFIRVHKGYIISVGKIDYIEENTVYINSIPIPVSRNLKDSLLKTLNLI